MFRPRQNNITNALHNAVKENEMGLVCQLLDKGEDINGYDSNGCTPLYYACSYRQNISMINLLLERGAQPIIAGSPSKSPLIKLINNRIPFSPSYIERFRLVNLVLGYCSPNIHQHPYVLDAVSKATKTSDIGGSDVVKKCANKCLELFDSMKKVSDVGYRSGSFSFSSYLAHLFDTYANPPLFSFTWRHHKDLATTVARSLRLHDNNHEGCLDVITKAEQDARASGDYNDAGTFAGLLLEAKATIRKSLRDNVNQAQYRVNFARNY